MTQGGEEEGQFQGREDVSAFRAAIEAHDQVVEEGGSADEAKDEAFAVHDEEGGDAGERGEEL